MLLLETAIFYVLVGLGAAVAVYVRSETRPAWAGAAPLVGACLFWPLFLPMLLSRPADIATSDYDTQPAPPPDRLDTAIAQVESELDMALEGLDGWAENVLACERRRLEELRMAWRTQAERIRALDRLLVQSLDEEVAPLPNIADNARALHSEEVRRQNMRQLQALRDRMHADLVGTLAWVRELVTMIHLAKFSGAPAARAEELIAQIAAAVEGLSEISGWRDQEQYAVRAG